MIKSKLKNTNTAEERENRFMKIFVIEDEESIRIELIQLLEKYGYDCASNCNFKDIVNIAQSYEPDLILLDINLPFQDGFQICREIRQFSMTPIIILTSRINRSLCIQTEIFFTAPLIVAGCISAVFMNKAMEIVEGFMNIHISTNVIFTIIFFLIIYGSYFIATYLSCKQMVKENQNKKEA